MANVAMKEAADDMELAAAKLAIKNMTAEQLLKLNKAATEAKDEAVKLRKQLEQRSLQAKSEADAPQVSRKAIFEQLTEWLEFNFPGIEFNYERAYLAQKLANSATYLGRNKKARKKAAVARRNKAFDTDLNGVAQEFGVEIPQVELQRAEESLSTLNESMVRCKALQLAAIVYYEVATGAKWEEPPEFDNNNRQGRNRGQSANARSFHPRDGDEDQF